jgi:hypothetical protein
LVPDFAHDLTANLDIIPVVRRRYVLSEVEQLVLEQTTTAEDDVEPEGDED